MKHYLIILLLSLLAIISHGYQYAVSDQEIFIPYILKAQDPDLFKNDILFDQISAQTSVFYPAVATISKTLSLEITFFVGFLIFQFLFFVGLYNLSNHLLKDKRIAYFSLLVFFLPKFIGGTATATFDTFFGYRSVGVIFLIFYLFYLLKHQFIKTAVMAAVGFWFHPLSIIPSLALLPVLHLAKSSFNFKEVAKPLIIFLLISFPLILITNGSHSLFSALLSRDSLWLSIIRLRDDYIFPSLWTSRGWAAFFLYITLVMIFLKVLRKEIKRDILLIFAASLAIFVINYLILDLHELPSFAKFQLARSITPLAYIALCISPLLLIGRNQIQKFLGLTSFIALSLNQFNTFLILIILYTITRSFGYFKGVPKFDLPKDAIPTVLIFALVIFLNLAINFKSFQNINQKIQFPKQSNDWIDLQLWARENTAKTALFLAPPDQTGFRIFSQRPIVADIKDGAVVMYSSTYAKKWFDKAEDTRNYQSLAENDFLKLKSKYNFQYLVSLNNQKLPFAKIYSNSSFSLYKM